MTQFSAEEKRGLYRAMYDRRDVRSHFLPDPVPDDVLARRRRFVETETWNARGAKLAEIIEQLNVS